MVYDRELVYILPNVKMTFKLAGDVGSTNGPFTEFSVRDTYVVSNIYNTSQFNFVRIALVYRVILKGTPTLVPPYYPLFRPVNSPYGEDRKP